MKNWLRKKITQLKYQEMIRVLEVRAQIEDLDSFYIVLSKG